MGYWHTMLAEHAAESVSEASERRYASNSDMAPQAVPKHAKTESASNASAPRSVRWMSPDLACSAAASSVRCAARVCSSVSNEANPCVASTEVRTSNGSVRAISNRAFVCATVALPTMTCGTDRCLPNWPGRRAVDAMAPKVASTRTATARICRGFIGASSSLELVTRPRATVCRILSLNTARVTYETCAKTRLFPGSNFLALRSALLRIVCPTTWKAIRFSRAFWVKAFNMLEPRPDRFR
ncbi:MAG: hypothetical protein JWN63_814 [Candidatus Acidoferrum typicum]|nr:hypothetical protein [Candidatus Acidoferrum typicum]